MSTETATADPDQAGSSHADGKKAIISPWIDTLCVGGISIVWLVPLFLMKGETFERWGLEKIILLSLLINWPHFIASYRLLYGDRQMVKRYKSASLYIPVLVAAYAVFALAVSATWPIFFGLFVVIAGFYVAWHYIGQTWGMMATFAYLEGVSFSDSERRWVRSGLNILLVWHLTWFMYIQGDTPPALEHVVKIAYLVMGALTLVAIICGLVGLFKLRMRTGRMVPVRVLVPWLAQHMWYGMMAKHPGAFFWAQISHALQYLMFPARVEANRRIRDGYSKSRLSFHMAGYGLLLVVVAFVALGYLPHTGRLYIEQFFSPKASIHMTFACFINIHHYFIDGCVWKISNPTVRKDLFAHLAPGTPAASSQPPIT